jgi:hypothetical protein
MLSLDYFPERYRIHLLVPLALNIAAGLTLFQRAGLRGVTRALQRMSQKRRIAASTILALPTAAFWAPLLASGYHLIGGDAGHLRIRVAAVAVALAPTVMVLAMQFRRGRPPLAFIIFPVTATLAWLISDRAGLDGLPFWPAPEHDPWTWTLAVGWLAIPAAWALARLLTGRMASWRLRAIPIAAAAYVFLSMVRILPTYIVPQYTMKQASESLGRELSGFKGVIATSAAETLFNANTLQYRNTPDFGERQPDALIVAFDVPNVEREYRLVARWEIFISPRYVWPPERAPEAGRSRLPVKLYVRRLARTARAADSW